ncbi:Na+/H+ antiporter NhaC family protein, partial [Romboutsia ilealis]|nr:Na+/H+ antiporter NhaC family protein [Romboutsia ilealis]
GAMFGDNLSMISDTTIAAVKTQGCEMKDKFKANFLLVLPAAVITIIIFLIITRDVRLSSTTIMEYNLWKVLPYILVLVG